jgi:aryl-alcohol dehydrogenase-like predicted oxidoreductase
MLKVANELDRSPAQVALRWTLEQPAITSAIVGARTLAHLEDNIQAADFHLENEHLQRLNDISHLPDRYPEAMEKNRDKQRAEAMQIPGNR